jgi:hypothetical protein
MSRLVDYATPARQEWTPASIRVIQPPPCAPLRTRAGLPLHCGHVAADGVGLWCCACGTTWPSLSAWAGMPSFECRGGGTVEVPGAVGARRCGATEEEW